MNSDQKIIPVVLSGGAGTRLWPLSREASPKQFLSFGSDNSLIQNTLLRCRGGRFSDQPIIVSLEAQKALIEKSLSGINLRADVLLEPARRDSCAAVIVGACLAMEHAADAMVLVLAADHHIGEVSQFQEMIFNSVPAANERHIVTFGIRPKHAATGYGYIRPGKAIDGSGCVLVEKFVEKPAADVAKRYVSEGYLWNSGNFLSRADVLIGEARLHVPAVLEAVLASLAKAKRDATAIHLSQMEYEKSPKISLDYAIMEKTTRAAVMPVSYDWNDIGTWDSVATVLPQDEARNALAGDAVVIAGGNNLVFSKGVFTVLQGVDDLIVVATPEAVMVVRKGDSEKVKQLVNELTAKGYKLPL
jgi:mannose-1-phosphate guanylyltransferase / mannose-6-phosphate isomerase